MMTQKRLVWAGLVLGLLLGFLAAFVFHPLPSEASRNGSGTYSLPSGNPVVTGTTITSVWANNTCSDIATEITNSLDRNGRGPMLAPLQLANGTKAAPALTWSAQTSVGLYRAGTTDVRMSCNNTDCTKWGPLGTDFPLSITAETLTSNGDAIGCTGLGSGRGIAAVGGASGGAGVSAQGGAAGGTGLVSVGGAGDGGGVIATAAAPNGVGVVGLGAGSGQGGIFTGGGSDGVGLTVTGGATNGDGTRSTGAGTGKGVWGIGGTTGVGVVASNGTAATGGTRQDAIQATNGDIKLDGVANVTSTTAIKNRVTPSNIVKAWGKVHGDGTPGVTGGSGFNITSVACAANTVTITLAQAFSDTNFLVITDQPFGTGSAVVQCSAGSSSTILCIEYSAGVQQNMCALGTFFFLALGNQ